MKTKTAEFILANRGRMSDEAIARALAVQLDRIRHRRFLLPESNEPSVAEALAKVEQALMRLDGAVADLRSATAEAVRLEARGLAAQTIAAAIAARFGLTMADMVSPSRNAKLARVRHLAIYTVKSLRPELSYSRIGAVFGGRDHSTIMHALNRAPTLLQDPLCRSAYDFVVGALAREGEGAAP